MATTTTTTDNVIQQFIPSGNRWILDISNTNSGIEAAINILKAALAENKIAHKRASVRFPPISDFINYCCKFGAGPCPADTLRKSFCFYSGMSENSISPGMFGKLMTEYINSELNHHGISRKAIRTGSAYWGLSPFSLSTIARILAGTTVDTPTEPVIEVLTPTEPVTRVPTPTQTVIQVPTPTQPTIQVPTPTQSAVQVPTPTQFLIKREPVLSPVTIPRITDLVVAPPVIPRFTDLVVSPLVIPTYYTKNTTSNISMPRLP